MRLLKVAVTVLVIPMGLTLSAAENDACSALPTTKLEGAQKAKFVSTKSSHHDDGRLTTSSCYYRMDPEALSASLQVLSHSKGDTIDLHEFWESRFAEDAGEREKKEAGEEHERRESKEKEREGEDEKQKPPQKVAGLGEEAFWVDTGRDGALYVISGSKIYRLSLGGSAPQEEKKERAVTLIRTVLNP